MLPITTLKLIEPEKGQFGAVGWSAEFQDTTFFFGSWQESPTVVMMQPGGVSAAPQGGVYGFVCTFENPSFEVDPTSVSRFHANDDMVGSLVIHSDDILIAAPSPNLRGVVAINVGKLEEKHSLQVAIAFRKWKLIANIDGRPRTIFEHGSGAAAKAANPT